MSKNSYQERVNEIAKFSLELPKKRAFAAVHGKQGKHSVYTIMMPLAVLAELFEADIGSAFTRSQRPVNGKRAKGVTSYILNNSTNYVIPSLTATIEDFTPSKDIVGSVIYDDADFITSHIKNEDLENSFGDAVVLSVPETSRWWFIDGQHRATGIQGLKSALGAMGMVIDDMFQYDTVAIMVRLDSGLEDRQHQFSIINSNMVKPNANLNSLYRKKERTGAVINSTIRRYFKLSDLEFDKSSCSGKNPKRFAYKHLVDASLDMLNCKIDDDISEDDISNLDEMWKVFTSLSVWQDFYIKTAQNLREQTIAPHAVFIAGYAQSLKKIKSDNVSFDSIFKVFNQKLDYSRAADCWQGVCVFDGKLVKNSKTVSATAEYIYSIVSCHPTYKRQQTKAAA